MLRMWQTYDKVRIYGEYTCVCSINKRVCSHASGSVRVYLDTAGLRARCCHCMKYFHLDRGGVSVEFSHKIMALLNRIYNPRHVALLLVAYRVIRFYGKKQISGSVVEPVMTQRLRPRASELCCVLEKKVSQGKVIHHFRPDRHCWAPAPLIYSFLSRIPVCMSGLLHLHPDFYFWPRLPWSWGYTLRYNINLCRSLSHSQPWSGLLCLLS